MAKNIPTCTKQCGQETAIFEGAGNRWEAVRSVMLGLHAATKMKHNNSELTPWDEGTRK